MRFKQRQAISNFPNELSGNGHLALGLKKWACRNVGQELANDLQKNTGHSFNLHKSGGTRIEKKPQTMHTAN